MMYTTVFLCAAFVLLSLSLQANAHGFPIRVTVDGKEYAGANGPSASSDSPVRKVSSNNPVTDPNSNNIICGLGAEQASSSASAKPGSTLEFYWGTISGGNWFHNVGPIMTYMAACSGDCSSFSPDSSTAWFKIDQQGESTDGDSSSWAQAKLLDGSPATVKIPDGLVVGNYLVRHELISLQNSVSEGGTEYYPSCLQVTVVGDASGQPDTTVNFPGAYSKTDPGILGDFYTNSKGYRFPGGPVATIGGSGSSSGNSSGSSGSSSSSSSSSDAPSTKTGGPGGASPTASESAAAGVGNVGASPSASGPNGAPSPTFSGKCRATKKRQLKRRERTSNGTSSETQKRLPLKMHKRRSAHHIRSF